jgi:serine/threonine protein phosphatase PrpC
MQTFADGLVSDSVGCTANVVLMVDNTLYVANAGDSRSALSRNGKIIELSKDHKP